MKKGIFTIGILALCVINLVLNIVIVFTMLPSIKNTDKLVTKITNLVDLDTKTSADKNGVVDLDKLEGVDVETTVTLTNVSTSSKFSYAKVTVYVSLNTTVKDYKQKKTTFEDKKQITISIIDGVISKYTAENVLDNKDKIREEILAQLKTTYGDALIYDVSFSQFNFQR